MIKKSENFSISHSYSNEKFDFISGNKKECFAGKII